MTVIKRQVFISDKKEEKIVENNQEEKEIERHYVKWINKSIYDNNPIGSMFYCKISFMYNKINHSKNIGIVKQEIDIVKSIEEKICISSRRNKIFKNIKLIKILSIEILHFSGKSVDKHIYE